MRDYDLNINLDIYDISSSQIELSLVIQCSLLFIGLIHITYTMCNI